MNDVMRVIAAGQAGCVASWQLRRAGLSWDAIRHRTRGMRRLYDGVYLSRGPERRGTVRICRAKLVQATSLNGLPITTPERTLTDLWPRLDEKARAKTLRNALRLKLLTLPSLNAHLQQAKPRQRPQSLTSRLATYETLHLHRCRSDAEAAAVVALAERRIAPPQINVRIAGEEADLSWPDRRLIVEIDGGTYHQDKLEDARKTAIWRAAGWHVERVPAQTIYDEPEKLIRAARPGS